MKRKAICLITVATFISTLLVTFWIKAEKISYMFNFKNVSQHGRFTPKRFTQVYAELDEITDDTTVSPFQGFNNETGSEDGTLIVPNIVHILRFGINNFSYIDIICLLSILRNHRPEKIMFHTDVQEFVGPYWDKVKNKPGFVYEMRNVTLPDSIFGQKFRENWRLWHASDVTRIRILMTYGGIFLDNDVYVVQNLDEFRKFEMVVGCENDNTMGTQVLIAHKDARFLKLWLKSYRQYYPERWYYNAGVKPVEEIIKKQGELVHWVKRKLGVHLDVIGQSFAEYWKEWRTLHTIHLSYRNRPLQDKFPTFDENMIKNYNMTFGEMAREVYATLDER